MNLQNTVYKIPEIKQYDDEHKNVQEIIDELGLSYAFELLDAINDKERKGRKILVSNKTSLIGSPTLVYAEK